MNKKMLIALAASVCLGSIALADDMSMNKGADTSMTASKDAMSKSDTTAKSSKEAAKPAKKSTAKKPAAKPAEVKPSAADSTSTSAQ